MAVRSVSAGEAPAPPPPSFGGFVARLLLYLFVVSLAFSIGHLHLHMGPVQRLLARGVARAANLFGARAIVWGSVIQLPQTAFDINHECTGIFVLLVYATFVAAYPAPWSRRAAGLTLGLVVLTSVNFVRLVLLAVIASRRPEWFHYFHEYFFQGLFIALLAFLAAQWTEQVRRAALGDVSR